MALEVAIPGRESLCLEHLLLDANGTLTTDGALLDGVPERVRTLSEILHVVVITADTLGTAADVFGNLPVELLLLGPGAGGPQKLTVLERLGPHRSAAVGNGENDRLMLEAAALGVAVVGREGAASGTLRAADLVVSDIIDALDLLLSPKRLRATLRG